MYFGESKVSACKVEFYLLNKNRQNNVGSQENTEFMLLSSKQPFNLGTSVWYLRAKTIGFKKVFKSKVG